MRGVTRGLDPAGLRRALREELAAWLSPTGWRTVGDISGSGLELVSLIWPVDRDFAATAEIVRASSIPDRLPLTVTHVLVGVSYEPLRRLWPLLGRYRVSVFSEDVHETDDPEDWHLEVDTDAQVVSAAGELAGLVLEHAVTFAERYASLERLLAEFEDDEMHMTVPALLAAARRFDEAHEALCRFRSKRGFPEAGGESRRFARQLGRWINSRGDPALLPSQPPPTHYGNHETESSSEIWQDARRRQLAVDAVRHAGRGKDRTELRALLEAELAKRGLFGGESALDRGDAGSPLGVARRASETHGARTKDAGTDRAPSRQGDPSERYSEPVRTGVA
jgi:hypothetical protein